MVDAYLVFSLSLQASESNLDRFKVILGSSTDSTILHCHNVGNLTKNCQDRRRWIHKKILSPLFDMIIFSINDKWIFSSQSSLTA